MMQACIPVNLHTHGLRAWVKPSTSARLSMSGQATGLLSGRRILKQWSRLHQYKVISSAICGTS